MNEFKCYICDKEFDAYNKLSVHCNRKHKILYKEVKEKYFPRKDLPFKCIRCNCQFEIYDSLRKHVGRIHAISSKNFYLEYKLNGIKPKCKCGCGIETNWNISGDGFRKYCYKHHVRVHNNWGHNPIAIQKSAETRRKQYASGERKMWSYGLTKETSASVARISEMSKKENNPERAKKISETQKKQFVDGIRNNSGKNNPMYGKKHSVETLKKIFSSKKMNKLEYTVANILSKNNIDYYFQFFISKNGICKSFDFKIKGKPILLEIDGDYWHGGSGSKFHHKSVDKIKENDRFKDELAKSNGYKLFRFWEHDIKKNLDNFTEILLKSLEIPLLLNENSN